MIFGKAAEALHVPDRRGWFFELVYGARRREVRRPSTATSMVRVSDLPYFCAREEAIRAALGVETYENLDWERRWRMSRGSGMHATMQDDEFPLLGCIEGMWRCGGCGHLHGRHPLADEPFGIVPRPERCGECGSKDLAYKESTLSDATLGLRGRADGFWTEKGAVWEVKSCAPGTYAYVLKNGPPKSHRAQGGAYVELVNRMLDDLGSQQEPPPQEDEAAPPPFGRVFFLYVPMDDVTHVSVPPPRDRVVPYEVDSVTKAIFCEMEHESLKSYFEEAHARVRAFREWIGQFGPTPLPDVVRECEDEETRVLLPARHPSCTCAGNAGQWKWGCDFGKGCMELADKFERSSCQQ